MYLMTDLLTGYVVPASAGLAGDPGLKASRHSTGGAVSVFETSIGAGPPLHVHDREDECFYVLDGELSIRCGDDAFAAVAGSLLFLPRGRLHRFWAAGHPVADYTSATPAPAGPGLNGLNVWVRLAGLAGWRRRLEGVGISGPPVLDKGWAR